MKVLVLILSLVALCTASTVNTYSACDSVGHIVSLDVDPCDGTPCRFPHGRNITLKVTFNSPTQITAAKPDVYAHLGLVTVPEPFHMEQDACSFFSGSCPLAANTNYIYTTSVFISPAYPKIRLAVEWQLRDQNDQKVICFVVPVEVVD